MSTKSWTKPTPELIDQALASTTQPEQLRYFLNKLQNPHWVKPLWEKGFFRTPPERVPTEGGGFQIPFWPESQYLARVAKEADADVVAIITKIRTDNPRVMEDVVDIALAIDSPTLSKKLFKFKRALAQNQFARFYYQKLGKLILHWAKLGLKVEALKLTESIISFYPDPRKKEKEEKRESNQNDLAALYGTKLEPAPRCDLYVYQKLLDEPLMELAELLPWETAKLVTKCLDNAILWSCPKPERQNAFDASDFWCREMKHPKKYGDEPKGYLAHALTKICELLLNKEPTHFGEMDNLLRSHRWYFFSRLRWHLYAHFPKLAEAQIRKEAIDFKDYENGEYGYEFALMLTAACQYNFLNHRELNDIFAQIAKGPNIEDLKQWQGGKITDEQIEARRGYFFTKQMFPFRGLLPQFADYWNKYQKLVEKYKERTLDDYFKVGEPKVFTVEEKGPITADDLLAKSDIDLLDFVTNWRPQTTRYDFGVPYISGLSKIFTEALKKSPQRFLDLAGRLKLPPVYVRDFLYFITERAKQKQALPWPSIIELCEWIIAQPDHASEENQTQTASEIGGSDFTESRHTLAGLLKYGSLDYSYSIPWELRPRVFYILKDLCSRYDSRLDGRGRSAFGGDLLTQAINSVRAEAVHALVDHAFWIKRHLQTTTDAMHNMPEVQEVLEDRLDPSKEESVAVHGLFGFLTPSLHYLDSNWRSSIHGRIYPEGRENSERWVAAWTTYVSWNHANPPIFNFMQSEYRRAIEESELIQKEEKPDTRPTEALGEHLIILYGLGFIPLSGENSLLDAFLKKANPKRRAQIMNYAGRALENTAAVPQEIKTRLMDYWASRLASAKRLANAEESSEELSDFAWWFRSGKFDLSWSLNQIQETLKFISKPSEIMFLIEDLSKNASERPAEVAACLHLIVKKFNASTYTYFDEEQVKHILRTALNSQLPEAVALANTVQDDLLRLGYFQFRELAEKL